MRLRYQKIVYLYDLLSCLSNEMNSWWFLCVRVHHSLQLKLSHDHCISLLLAVSLDINDSLMTTVSLIKSLSEDNFQMHITHKVTAHSKSVCHKTCYHNKKFSWTWAAKSVWKVSALWVMYFGWYSYTVNWFQMNHNWPLFKFLWFW